MAIFPLSCNFYLCRTSSEREREKETSFFLSFFFLSFLVGVSFPSDLPLCPFPALKREQRRTGKVFFNVVPTVLVVHMGKQGAAAAVFF